ncbi:MAG: hypothetical protein ACREOD_06980 [Candidatus Dormibacteria bacterium]
MLTEAARGCFPPADGDLEVVPSSGGWEVVTAFTGHCVVQTALSRAEILGAGGDGLGGAMAPRFLLWLAGAEGWVGSQDLLLAGWGAGAVPPLGSVDREQHSRVRRARQLRHDVRVYVNDYGLACLGRGVAGRWELSVELEPASRGRGHGRVLIDQVRRSVPSGEPVFAEVAPGNAASLRAFLACGFVPIGAEVLIKPGRRA